MLALVLPACDASPPHALLVTVDTLRRDHLGAYGETRELTPHLDALAAESLVFELAYAPAPFTRPSVASLLTGRYPEALGVVSNRHPLRGKAESLATRLRARGYRTAAVVSNAVLHPRSGLDRGFETYDARLPQRERVRRFPERTAEPTTEAALHELDRLLEGSAPFFLWIHYQDPHGPYTPREGLRERYQTDGAERPGDPERLAVAEDNDGRGAIPHYQHLEGRHDPAFYRAGYAGEVRHVDEEIGRILDALDERGLEDETLLLFASDHGEGLGERDYWFAHGEYLSDVLVRVPLFVRAPGGTAGRRSDVASLLDVVPTVLAALGLPPAKGLPGRDLLAEDAAEQDSTVHLGTFEASAVRRRGLIAEGWKYVRSERGPDAERFRPLRTEGGTAREGASELRKRMRARVVERWREVASTTRAPPPELDEEERRALESLGYLE